MTTHICIVSERLIPNLIPALMLRPERVLLVSSSEMERLGMTARLGDLLTAQGFAVTVEDGLPSGNLAQIIDFARNLRDQLGRSYPGEETVLNVTGGNKLMAIAFAQVLGPAVGKTIYTDTAHGLLEELPLPGESGGVSRPLDGVLSVPLYLAAQGMTVRQSLSDEQTWARAASARRSLTKYLGKQAAHLGDFLGVLNGMASGALDNRGEVLVEPLQRFRNRPRGHWAEAARRIEEAGLAAWDRGTALRIADLPAARYLSGGWLEEYA